MCVFHKSGWVTYLTFTVPPTGKKEKLNHYSITHEGRLKLPPASSVWPPAHMCSRVHRDPCEAFRERCIQGNESYWKNIDKSLDYCSPLLFSPTVLTPAKWPRPRPQHAPLCGRDPRQLRVKTKRKPQVLKTRNKRGSYSVSWWRHTRSWK